jgi:apolipoprotein N-acyltransferase
MSFAQLAALSVSAGILLATSYIPFPPWALFFGLVPLWIVWLREKSVRRIALAGWLTQFVSNLVGFNWVAHAVHELGLPWPVAAVCLFVFCAVNNAFFTVVGIVWFALSERFKLAGAAKIWLLPILMDIGQRLTPTIFNWNFGYPWLWARLPAFQLADIIGFQGLSTVTLLLNAIVLCTWCMWRRERPWLPMSAAGVALFGLLNLYGAWHAQGAGKGDAELTFLVVQPDIDYGAAYAQRSGDPYRTVVSKLSAITWRGLDSLGRADFVVWPEGAFPAAITPANSDTPYRRWLKQFVAGNWTPLITGGASWVASRREFTNSLFIFGNDGNLLAPRYDKTIPIAFGEHIPLEEWFPLLRHLRHFLPEARDLARGAGPAVLDTGAVRFGPQICYEGLFDWFTRNLAKQGAQILLNLGNDAVFGGWQEPYQHGFETLARAIEVRRPLIRVTNSGLSMVMLAGGRLLTVSPQNQPWVHLYKVPYAKDPPVTIFMTWGYWLFPIALAIALPALLASRLSLLVASEWKFSRLVRPPLAKLLRFGFHPCLRSEADSSGRNNLADI